MSKVKSITFVSPRGVAKYPRLDQPYSYSRTLKRSVPDPQKGSYEVTLIMSQADAKPLIDKIQQAIAQSGIDPENIPYKDGEEEGTVEVKFKGYGQDRDGNLQRVRMVDSKNTPIRQKLDVRSGSVMRINGWITVTEKGVRLNMRDVQLLKLVEQAVVFEPEEDGFNVSEYEGFEDNNDNNSEQTSANPKTEADSEDDVDF